MIEIAFPAALMSGLKAWLASALGADLVTGMMAGMVIGKLGPVVAVLLGVALLGWLVRQSLVKRVPLDGPLPETRVTDDLFVRERDRPPRL